MEFIYWMPWSSIEHSLSARCQGVSRGEGLCVTLETTWARVSMPRWEGRGGNDQVRDFWSLLLSYGFCVFIYTGHQQPDEVQATYIRLSPQIFIFISRQMNVVKYKCWNAPV